MKPVFSIFFCCFIASTSSSFGMSQEEKNNKLVEYLNKGKLEGAYKAFKEGGDYFLCADDGQFKDLTIFHAAVKEAQHKIAFKLIKHGFDPRIEDKFGESIVKYPLGPEQYEQRAAFIVFVDRFISESLLKSRLISAFYCLENYGQQKLPVFLGAFSAEIVRQGCYCYYLKMKENKKLQQDVQKLFALSYKQADVSSYDNFKDSLQQVIPSKLIKNNFKRQIELECYSCTLL